jgi:thiol-disulfide isomerase/thioredoxin
MKLFSVIILTAAFAWATKGPDKNLTFSAKKNSENEIRFLPPENHHFNLEAPSEVSKIHKKKSEKATLDKKESEIKAKWNKIENQCDIEAQLYLCDNEKTYCVPIKRKFSCENLNAQNTDKGDNIQVTLQVKAKKEKADHLFFINQAQQAIEKAKSENKMLLIDFYGVWCPPCNYLDEEVFSKPQFKAFSKDFVFLKMDADDPISFELKSQFNVKGYPTIVLANNNLEEVNRIVGSRSPEAFFSELRKTLKYKGISLAKRIAEAQGLKKPEYAFDLAEMYQSLEDHQRAMHFFILAMKNGNWTEDRRNQLLTSQIAVTQDPKLKAALIESSFISFPFGVKTYERAQQLVELSESLKDESVKNRAYHAQLKNAEHLLKNPNLYKNSELTKPDLYFMLAEVYEHSKDSEKAKAHYLKAFEEYTNLIKVSKLEDTKARSYNLNRIYALHKAGRSTEASELYEKMQTAYPQEFTFYYNHASQLKDLGEFHKALSKAELAYEFSYGDNKLRAVHLLAELKMKIGDKKEAKALIEDTIKNTKIPEGLNVRTHRYIDRLKKLL